MSSRTLLSKSIFSSAGDTGRTALIGQRFPRHSTLSPGSPQIRSVPLARKPSVSVKRRPWQGSEQLQVPRLAAPRTVHDQLTVVDHAPVVDRRHAKAARGTRCGERVDGIIARRRIVSRAPHAPGEREA